MADEEGKKVLTAQWFEIGKDSPAKEKKKKEEKEDEKDKDKDMEIEEPEARSKEEEEAATINLIPESHPAVDAIKTHSGMQLMLNTFFVSQGKNKSRSPQAICHGHRRQHLPAQAARITGHT